MLISKVPESDAGRGEGGTSDEDHSHEYQTASELFELMSKNQNFVSNDVKNLTTQDLVLLYKNLDLGTKLMANANEIATRKSNQYVETVVYNDPESDESELSEIYSNEDLQHVFMVNNERIDLLNSQASRANTLCPKFGDLEIRPSHLSDEFGKHFLFKDSCLQKQLKNLNLSSNNTEDLGNTILPASLLDYICSKQLDDNYSFYMENVIRHVQHTIEHLKRISNGDFLTEKAKEKWREVENINKNVHRSNTKVLVTSSSIPLHIERKNNGIASMWNDIVHSAVDIRSLSKILEKRIVVEVPKLVSGSYRFLTKHRTAMGLFHENSSDNLIISCKKKKRSVELSRRESRVNVVIQLQRSETGQVMNKVSSIMILETKALSKSMADSKDVLVEEIPQPLPLDYKVEIKNEMDIRTEDENNTDLQELSKDEDNAEEDFFEINNPDPEVFLETDIDTRKDDEGQYSNYEDNPCEQNIDSASDAQTNDEYEEYGDPCQMFIDNKIIRHNEPYIPVSPTDLRMTIQRLSKQAGLAEENEANERKLAEENGPPSTTVRKKSPTRARIKSPYENKSLLMEEKKRKKLLEIRERRERKKLALAENCKIKPKYGNGSPVPQPSNSVTRLSITNKSFYNSIYGRNNGNVVTESKQGKDYKPIKREIGLALEGIEEDSDNVNKTPLSEKNIKKYIDRSYYLDEAETEIRHVDEDKKSICSTSNSGVSADFCANLNLLTHLVSHSDSDFTTGDDEALTNTDLPLKSEAPVVEHQDIPFKTVDPQNTVLHVVPSNSPTNKNDAESNADKSTTLVECRKSIDKIYDLLNKIGKTQEGSKIPKSKFTANNPEKIEMIGNTVCSSCPDSDSGTSLKHQSSSYPSAFSFDYHKQEAVSMNTPKVIINSKEKKMERKSPKPKVPDNPLRAISQLLREFENVHKNRQKQNSAKKPDKLPDDKHVTRPNIPKRILRPDQQHDPHDRNNVKSPKERKARNATEYSKSSGRQSPSEEKQTDKVVKKKITDFIDEAKEARGEAVRGPSRFNSRLNTLAQPKRSYVQAHSEEYQTKYGRNMMANRLQKLATAPSPTPAPERNASSAISRNKQKRNGAEPVSAGLVKVPSPHKPPLERATKARFMTSKQEVKELQPGSSSKQNVPNTPETLVQKMSAVETYVKHDGRATSAVILNLETAQRSRVPLVPHDIELGSLSSSPVSEVERATELGSRLHYIIDNMLHTELNQIPLEVLPECQESSTKSNKETTENVSMVQNVSKRDQQSEYSEENFENHFENLSLVTPLESERDIPDKENKGNNVEDESFKHEKQPFKSLTNLEKSQEVSRRLSVGAFQKRLRIKNMSLSPKHSMTHVFVLQSGDTGSLVVKSTISQSNLKKTLNNITELTRTLPSLSKTHLDWNYTQLPMQVATVNYAMMPDYKSNMQSTSLVKLFDGSLRNKSVKSPSPRDKDTQCNEVRQPKPSEGIVSEETKDTQSELFKEIQNQLKYSNTDNNSTESPNARDSNSSPMHKIQNQIKDSKECSIMTKEDINCTSSLDMLMGLLNEIQKISTGQTTMTEGIAVNKNYKKLESKSSVPSSDDKRNRRDLISISSLDRLRQLESDPSLYSLYLSDSDQYDRQRNFGIGVIPRLLTKNNDFQHYNTLYADKEVCVDFTNKEYVDRYTDVPSQILPLSISYVTSSVQAESSVQSMFSCLEFQSTREFKDNNGIQDWVHIPTTDLLHIPMPELSFGDEFKDNIEITNANVKDVTENAKKSEVDDKCAEMRSVSRMIVTKNSETSSVETISNVNSSVMLCTKLQNLKIKDQTPKKSLCNLKYGFEKDFDPVMRMKRDILVTVYSILVFTVFAALSFPEVLYLT